MAHGEYRAYMRRLYFSFVVQNSTTKAASSDGPSVASEANLQIFMNDFVCGSNQNGTEYFFFEVCILCHGFCSPYH